MAHARFVAPMLLLAALAGCAATSDPAKLQAMSDRQLLDEWGLFKSQHTMNEFKRRGAVTDADLPAIDDHWIRRGMSRTAVIVSLGPISRGYRDSEGREILIDGPLYVRLEGGRVVEWWTVN